LAFASLIHALLIGDCCRSEFNLIAAWRADVLSAFGGCGSYETLREPGHRKGVLSGSKTCSSVQGSNRRARFPLQVEAMLSCARRPVWFRSARGARAPILIPRRPSSACATAPARATVNATREAERNLCAEAAQRGSPAARAGAFVAQNRIVGLPQCTPSAQGDAGHRLCPRYFAYLRPCRAQLGEVRVYRAAREGPESVTKLPQAVRKACTRPTVPDRSLEPVSSTRRQPSSREIERPESTYCGRSRPRP